jgi:hypothetical protein
MAVQAYGAAVTSEYAGAQGVECAHCDFPAGLLPDQSDDSGPQFRRRLVRERDRQDLPRPNALDADQIGDSMRQDASLAAAGAGQNENRSVRRRDRSTLLWIEPAQNPLRESVGRSLALRFSHRRRLER